MVPAPIVKHKLTATERNRLPLISGIGFEVQLMSGGYTLWVHPTYWEARGATRREGVPDLAAFHEEFAYAIPKSSSMRSVEFDPHKSKVYWAERYGGRGIGVNGGGVRVGNSGGYQIKGIGQNPLVGDGAELMHSYGGLTAAEAMYEAIYGYLTNCIMPIGSAIVYGIILTGPVAAYEYAPKVGGTDGAPWMCWGALMVREICRRPSHFLRAQSYKPDGLVIAPDVARVRAVNRALLLEFGSGKGYIQHLAQFLKNCANQFAFSKVMRLAHGTMAPSNLTMDGRWLDLARTTFIPSNCSNGNFVPSDKEANYVLEVAKEMLDTFAKFNRLHGNMAPLANYYKEQFSICLRFHIATLLGLNCGHVDMAQDSFSVLVTEIERVLSGDKKTMVAPPAALPADDLVVVLLRALFLSLADATDPQVRTSPCLAVKGFRWPELLVAFREVILASWRSMSHPDFTLPDFFRRVACRSLRQALLQDVFYKKRLDDHLRNLVRQQWKSLQGVVESYNAITDWAFGNADDNRTWLFRHARISVYIEPGPHPYRLHTDDLVCFDRANELLRCIERLNPCDLTINSYDFRPYLREILTVCHTLQDAHV